MGIAVRELPAPLPKAQDLIEASAGGDVGAEHEVSSCRVKEHLSQESPHILVAIGWIGFEQDVQLIHDEDDVHAFKAFSLQRTRSASFLSAGLFFIRLTAMALSIVSSTFSPSSL